MASNVAWAQFYDFDSPEGLHRLSAAERRSQRAYARDVIKDLLKIPVKTLRSGPVTCAVVFDRVAFLSEPGGFAVAAYKKGVITDADFMACDWLEGLPLRRSIAELKELILELAAPRVALAMSEWRGEPVDLRSNPHAEWALPRMSDEEPFGLEVDLRACLAEIPKTVFGQLLNDMAKVLAFDRSTASASCWMMLGEPDTNYTYQRLRRVSGVPEAQRAPHARSLIANAITMVFERHEAPASVTSAVRRFRELAIETGVTRIGWRLLLDSPLRYWSRLLRNGHDETKVWIALLSGQALATPRLPAQGDVCQLADLAFENGVEKALKCIPPQIWRSLLIQAKSRRRGNREEVSGVLAWAARTGEWIPKTIRRARWSSLRRHAAEHLLSRIDNANLVRPLNAHALVTKQDIVARRITNEAALEQTALVMRNCLRQYANAVESGAVVIYFAVRGKQRAVIMLEQSEPGGAWWAEEVKGPANAPAEQHFIELSWELCRLWNDEECMRPKVNAGG